MAFIEGIRGAVNTLVTGQGDGAAGRVTGPGDPAAALRQQLSPYFQKTFQRSIAEVLQEAINGRFEDPTLTAEAQLLRERLAARQAVIGARLVSGGGPGGAPSATVGAGGGAQAAPEEVAAIESDARRLLEIYHQQAQTRLTRVSSSLQGRFGAGQSLPSAASGQLDVRNFQPRDKREAQAFAERLAIDLTEGAARLEVFATKLDLARYEVERSGSAHAREQAAHLEQQYEKQQAFVLELAEVVDATSANAVSNSASAPADAQLGKVIGNAVREGASITDVEKLKKLHAMVVDEATTGNSSLVNNMRVALSSVIFEIWKQQELRDRERRAEEQRSNERKHDDQVAEQRHMQRRGDVELASARARQRRDDFMAGLIASYQKAREYQAAV